MVPIFRNNLGAAGYIIILQLVIIVFFGVTFIGSQLQSIDIKEIVSQANETTLNTNEAVKSGRALNVLLQELSDFANKSEISRQNQTRVFLPALQNSFKNVEQILNATQQIEDISNELKVLLPAVTNSVNNVINATTYLAENFGPDTGYIERENFQYEQANETSKVVEEIRGLLRDLNNTLS